VIATRAVDEVPCETVLETATDGGEQVSLKDVLSDPQTLACWSTTMIAGIGKRAALVQ